MTKLLATGEFIHQSNPEQLQHLNEVVIGMTLNEQDNTNESNKSNNESDKTKSTNTNTTPTCPPSASLTKLPTNLLTSDQEKEHISIDDNTIPYNHRSKWYSPEA
jgi:hypothetical protein